MDFCGPKQGPAKYSMTIMRRLMEAVRPLCEAKRPAGFVYHMTNSRNLPAIKRGGLRPPTLGKQDSNWGGDMGVNSADKVFFAADEKTAQYYGDIIRRGVDRDNIYHTFFAILRVPIQRLPDLTPDKDRGEFYTHRSVAPRYIEMKWGDRNEYRPILSADVDGIATGDWDDVKDDEDE